VGNDLPVLLSFLYLAKGDMDKAAGTVDKLVQYTLKDGLGSKGVSMFYLHAAGHCLALLGRYNEALVMQQRLAALDENYPLTDYLLGHLKGLIALLTGNETDAAISLAGAAKLEIELPMARIGGSARLLQARLLLQQGNPDGAFAVANPVLDEWQIATTPGYVLLDGPVILPVLKLVAERNGAGASHMLQLFSEQLHNVEQKLLPDPLTPRERDVLKLLVAGHTNLQISTKLFISSETVKSHVAHIFRKLDVRSRAKATIRARELGFGDESPPNSW
jgi:DNA-binding CsgD family transcriptional regulator